MLEVEIGSFDGPIAALEWVKPIDTDRERAALHWTEAVTHVADGQVPDAVYDAVRPHFSEKELADLTLAIATINAWNRLSIAARLTPGMYQPAQFTT